MTTLVNPDIGSADNKYSFDGRFQQEILGMLLRDKVFLIQSLGLIKPEYFIESSHELVCHCLFDYFKIHRNIPAEHILRELIRENVNDEVKRLKTCSELKVCIRSYSPGISSREFNLTKITEFAKEQALKGAMGIALKLSGRRDDKTRWLKIEDAFRKALAVDRSFDEGLDYFASIEERYKRMRLEKEQQEVFYTGFKALDDLINMGGLKRGEIGAFMGLPGTGKSNFLIKSARTNIQNNKNVVYISLEMSQDKIAARMDSQFARVDMKHIPDFVPENENQYDVRTESLLKDRVEGLFSGLIKRPKFVIKQFPAGQADVNTIRAFMSQINLDGFKPDLLIVDYVGEMKDFEGIKVYESRQKLVRDLRALAVEEQICIMTAMQPNRMAREQEENSEIDDSTLGDSFGQARPLDSLWSINQNRQEKEAGVGRIFVVKNRDGQSRKVVHFRQSKDCLDFEDISPQDYSMIMSRASDVKTEKVTIEDLFSKKKNNDSQTHMPGD